MPKSKRHRLDASKQSAEIKAQEAETTIDDNFGSNNNQTDYTSSFDYGDNGLKEYSQEKSDSAKRKEAEFQASDPKLDLAPSLTVSESSVTLQGGRTTSEQILQLNINFCRQTTAHGWGRVGRAPNHVVRSAWVVISFIALALNIGHVFLLTSQYMIHKSEIKIILETTETRFPSVSICNLIPWSYYSADELLQDTTSKTYQWKVQTSNLSQYDDMAAAVNRSSEFEWLKNRMQQPTGYYENIGTEVFQLGHNFKDFILSCKFDQRDCNYSNFKYFTIPNFFNCYTFRPVGMENGRTTGPNDGLSMILYLEALNKHDPMDGRYYTHTNIDNAAGVRVVIHQPETRPIPVDHGFDVPPGFSANIALDVNYHVRLNEPYGKCINEKKERSSIFDLYAYSTDDCFLSCQASHIMEKCNCVSSMLPLPDMNKTELGYCGNWNVSTVTELVDYMDKLKCEARNMSNFMENMTVACGCYPACDSFEYEQDVSYSSWPVRHAQEDFFKTYVLDHPDATELTAYKNLAKYNITELVDEDLIRSNFLRINIFRKSMVIKEHHQQPSYDISKLLSDLGGTFGLWIGMSVISWCEVIELLFMVIFTACKAVHGIYKA